MKKLALSALALFALNSTFAQEKTEQSAQQATQPVAMLQIFDVSGQEPKLLEGNKLSRAKAREVCLVIGNVNWQDENLFAANFKAPEAIDLTRLVQNGEVRVSEDKKEMLVATRLAKAAVSPEGVLAQCWTMDKTDPLGTYEMEVQVNDVVFKGLAFEVLK